jgi:hypothetical protein
VTVNKSILIACGVVGVAFAALAYVASAQTPARRAPVRLAASADEPSKSPAAAQAAVTAADSSKRVVTRETYSYLGTGRRDPFVSLIANGDLRPMISDLRLVTVIYAPQGRSVAVMRDASTDEQYRVRTGQTLGRMRVARISPKSVTFTIEEYGFSRQEVLALNDTTRARSQ